MTDTYDNFFKALGSPTTETSSAGSDWSGIFGKLLDTGSTVAGSFFKAKSDATVAKDKNLQAAYATSATTKILYALGIAAVVGLVAFLIFRRR